MKRAIDNLIEKFDNNIELEFLIIDGVRWEGNFDIPCHSIIKGDDKYFSISAASILAKEEHDISINNYVTNNPEMNSKYDLLKNKGYGTKKHLIGLEFGPSVIIENHLKDVKK